MWLRTRKGGMFSWAAPPPTDALVVAVPDGMGGFVHNGAIHLIDASGTVRGIYDLDQWPQALERALALAGARRT